MTEAEYRRAQEYMLEAWWEKLPGPEMSYALAWLAYLYAGQRLGKAPNAASCGVDDLLAAQTRESVESLLMDLRTPGFDQDDPATL